MLGDPVVVANLANVTASGALKVDGSAVTQPVSQPTAANLNATTVGASTPFTVTWNSATTGGTNVGFNCAGYGAVAVSLAVTGTITGGQIRFLANAGSGGSDISGMRIGGSSLPRNQLYDAQSFHNLATGDTWIYWFPVAGFDSFSFILQLAIIGSGSVTLIARAVAQSITGPTTVGQSDPTKHRVSVYGNPGSFTTLSNQTTGGNVTFTVPAATKWILKSTTATLATSATVANRQMFLLAQDAAGHTIAQTTAISSSTAVLNQAASTTVVYLFSPGTQYFITSPIVGFTSSPFPEVVLGPGFVIQTNIQAFQSGDVVTLTINVIQLPD